MGLKICAETAAGIRRDVKSYLRTFGSLSKAGGNTAEDLKQWAQSDADIHEWTGQYIEFHSAVVDGKAVLTKEEKTLKKTSK